MGRDIAEVAKAALDDPDSRARVHAGTEQARSMAWINIDRIHRGARPSRDAELFELGGRDG
jgi:hypothetical protein